MKPQDIGKRPLYEQPSILSANHGMHVEGSSNGGKPPRYHLPSKSIITNRPSHKPLDSTHLKNNGISLISHDQQPSSPASAKMQHFGGISSSSSNKRHQPSPSISSKALATSTHLEDGKFKRPRLYLSTSNQIPKTLGTIEAGSNTKPSNNIESSWLDSIPPSRSNDHHGNIDLDDDFINKFLADDQ
jgi:hypothetical protein